MMVDSQQNEVKLDFSKELKESIQKNLELEAKLEDSDRRNRSKDTIISQLRKERGEASEPKPPVEPKPEPQPVSTPPKVEAPEAPQHAMSITDAFCPTCGTVNEKFKGEAWCENCGHELGAIETLNQVKNCPGCKAEGKIAKQVKPPRLKFNKERQDWDVVRDDAKK